MAKKPKPTHPWAPGYDAPLREPSLPLPRDRDGRPQMGENEFGTSEATHRGGARNTSWKRVVGSTQD
jgi:hypothetical protein